LGGKGSEKNDRRRGEYDDQVLHLVGEEERGRETTGGIL